MIEKVSKFAVNNKKIFENLAAKDKLVINHVVIEPKQCFPVHPTDADVYMIVNEGEISLKLNKQPVHKYEAGCLIEIPFGTLSEISNKSNEITELFVIKILNKS